MPKVDISWDDKWEFEYEGNKIVVKNSFDSCQLVINGKVQDAQHGLTFSATLRGKLPDGAHVKATVGGVFKTKCSVFVNHEMLKPIKKD